jgi:hypothetical protein
MEMTATRWSSTLGLVCLTALVVTGCNRTAEVRFVQASPDALSVDITLRAVDNGTVAAAAGAVTYTTTTPFFPVNDDGQFVIELRPAGQTAAPAMLVTPSFKLNHDETLTAIIAGLAGSTDPSVSLRVLLQEEDFGNSVSGSSRVVFVNTSVDSPTVQFTSSTLAASTGGIPLFSATSATGAFLPANQPLQVTAASPASATPVQTTFTTVPLLDESHTFFIAVGLTAALPRQNTAFDLLEVGPAGTIAVVQQNPTVYVVHASPDAPPLDVATNGTALAAGVGFGQLSSPIQLQPGDYTFAVSASAGSSIAGTQLGTLSLPGLAAGQQYLEVVSGFITPGLSPTLTGATFVESFPIMPDQAQLSVIQASPLMPDVTMGTVAPFVPIVAFTNLSFLAQSQVQVVPTSFILGVAPTGSTVPVAEYNLALAPNDRSFGVNAGVPQPASGEQPLTMVVVNTTARPWSAAAVPNAQ